MSSEAEKENRFNKFKEALNGLIAESDNVKNAFDNDTERETFAFDNKICPFIAFKRESKCKNFAEHTLCEVNCKFFQNALNLRAVLLLQSGLPEEDINTVVQSVIIHLGTDNYTYSDYARAAIGTIQRVQIMRLMGI